MKRTEKDLAQILENNFVDGENKPIIRVNDISGGCGAMFDILVVSNKFEGQSLVKQHKMVMEILKKDIQSMHGLTINTKTPKQYEDIIKKK
ncbi:predicted protein [Naegleria gruberi]|uniref:Predicted protein n=1 Tax=Naegleria gruberi TaxID=5762 RepID=D2V472_NAEGR|nr:uncharacterized protein NAEGRDRAFT_30986 [Naegleria gruberi]EFC48331.1 predicted protein [Naegleria gruberi]|eukprot:XP_002681075.1 predicted protein [Naegleria gruberi strain NEG-M]